jgi:hypothetical protein
MASRRLALAGLLTGASGAALLVAMFALDWFSFVDPVQRRAAEKFGVTQESVRSLHSDGWHALPASRWVLLATCALCAAAVVTALRASPRLAARVDLVLLIVAVTSAGLVLLRVLDPPASNELATVEAGAYVGLAAAAGAACGAYLTIGALGTSLAGTWAELDAGSSTPRRTQLDRPPPAAPAPARDPNAPQSIPPPSARQPPEGPSEHAAD